MSINLSVETRLFRVCLHSATVARLLSSKRGWVAVAATLTCTCV